MKLLHIDALTCPTCAALTVAESRKNGHEKREFACGCVLHWYPSIEVTDVETPCPSTPAVAARSAKRAKALDALDAFVEALDVDPVWKATYRPMAFPK